MKQKKRKKSHCCNRARSVILGSIQCYLKHELIFIETPELSQTVDPPTPSHLIRILDQNNSTFSLCITDGWNYSEDKFHSGAFDALIPLKYFWGLFVPLMYVAVEWREMGGQRERGE